MRRSLLLAALLVSLISLSSCFANEDNSLAKFSSHENEGEVSFSRSMFLLCDKYADKPTKLEKILLYNNPGMTKEVRGEHTRFRGSGADSNTNLVMYVQDSRIVTCSCNFRGGATFLEFNGPTDK
jgi:hypothetical protein